MKKQTKKPTSLHQIVGIPSLRNAKHVLTTSIHVSARGATRIVSGRSHIAARVAVGVAFWQRLVGRVFAAAAGGAVDGLVGLEGGRRVTWNIPQTK